MSELDQGVLDAARDATEPSPAEVTSLLRAMRRERAPRPSALPIFAAGVLALVAVWVLMPGYGSAPSGDIALTDAGLRFGPAITVTGDGAATVLAADADGTHIRLDAGRLTASVEPERRFRALVIETPDGTRVSVQGTVFTVRWDGHAGSVSVARGAVDVRGPSASETVRGGGEISWNDGTAVGEGFSPDPIPAQEEEGGAPDLPDRGDRLPEPVPAATTASPTLQPAPVPAPVRQPPPAAAPTPPPMEPTEPEPVAALEPSAPSSSPDLARARAFGRVQEALEGGRHSDAAYLADLFLQRYPDGALSAEAGVLQIEAVAATDADRAVKLADLWLGTQPDHGRRVDVLTLRATLARDRLEDCRRALPSYRELARITTGGAQARALAYQGICAAQVGDAAQAAPALDAALSHSSLPRALAPRVRAARDRLREDSP